jgi:hypothetical protein
MFAGFAAFAGRARAGTPSPNTGYKVLAPIAHDNLTIFPVVASSTHDTRMFITLDEGLRSGEVVVTEAGQEGPLIRRRSRPVPPGPSAQVNRLVLVNNSDRPLILLAGEIVTGGKQDRVVGKDRIIPAKSDPVDLSVFCVEPGRWTGVSQTFGAMETAGRAPTAPMAQPSVRARAMADKNQQQVWNEVHKSADAMSSAVAAAPEARAQIGGTTSYARVMGAPAVAKQVDEVAIPVEHSYQSVIRQLRDQNAVGVVVAINGEIVWADVFASTPLLEKYWPKLVRSYSAEALTNRGRGGKANVTAAQAFLDQLSGTREIVESEPGVFRHTEIAGPGFRAFELASLLPKTNYDVHLSKMAE